MKSSVHKGYTVFEDGKIIGKFGKVLKYTIDKAGYRTVVIHHEHKRTTSMVHRLVAICFIPNPENKPEVNHKDRNKANNHVSNLEWCTRAENNRHAPSQKGRFGAMSAVSKKVWQIKDGHKINLFNGMTEAERETGISMKCISKVITGKCRRAGGFEWQLAS